MKNLLLSLLTTLGFCAGCQAQDKFTTLSPQDFEAAYKADTTAVVLDVRQPSEYEEGHLPGAILLDFLSQDTFSDGLTKLDKSKTYYVYCRSGRRSHNACVQMERQGFKVVDMQGGFLAWSAAGLPTETNIK